MADVETIETAVRYDMNLYFKIVELRTAFNSRQKKIDSTDPVP